MGAEPVSLWDHSAEEKEVVSDFRRDDVDVAIIGAGYTGLSAALHCAECGLSSQVIEAERIGFGGSGRNVGLVNAAAWLPPARITETLGPEYGPGFVKRFSEAPSAVFDLVRRHRIRCEATREGTVHAAHSRAGLRDLARRHAQWQRLGEPVDLLDRNEANEMIGGGTFHGGLLDHRAGTLNPMAYCRGLARAAVAAGARIATGIRATALKARAGGWLVETARGPVRATNVVIGTNAYTGDLWPGLNSEFTTIHFLQVATRPLGSAATHILPGRQGLWDTGPIMLSLRRDAAGRLIIGTMGRVSGSVSTGLTQRWAKRQIARMFPGIGPVELDSAWHGRIAMTADYLPRIHHLADGLWTPIGYNGRGITTGTLLGQSMADVLAGMDPGRLPLPVTGLTASRRSRAKSWIYPLAFAANQCVRSL